MQDDTTTTVWELSDNVHYAGGFEAGEAVVHIGYDRHGYYIVIMDGEYFGDDDRYDTLEAAQAEGRAMAIRRANLRYERRR